MNICKYCILRRAFLKVMPPRLFFRLSRQTSSWIFFIFLCCCFCFIFFRSVRLGKYCSLLFVEAQQKASCLGICVAGKWNFYRNWSAIIGCMWRWKSGETYSVYLGEEVTGNDKYYCKFGMKIKEWILNLHTVFYVTPQYDAILRKHFNSSSIPSISILEKSTTLLLINQHFNVGYPRPFMCNNVETGGIHITPPKKVKLCKFEC